MSDRDRILERVRAATRGRKRTEHPGPFGGWRPGAPAAALDGFAALFEDAGGEIIRTSSMSEAASWLATFERDFDSATTGATVPKALQPAIPPAAPDLAPLGVSMARGAIAETGSLVMDARDGRRSQLLAPTHVVFVRRDDIRATFRETLADLIDDLPSAIGLHSGPSKSADIGQILVRGVHGPGRIVAVVIEGD